MYRFWNSIIEPLCKEANIRSIVEVGIGQGHLTHLLLSYAKHYGATVRAIDPHPACDMVILAAEGGTTLTYHTAKSTDVLPSVCADLVLIDGDHNWYTVLQELRILSQWVSAGTSEPIILLHDTEWPYGRRDMYYDKETIPAAYRHPSALRGLLPSKTGLEQIGGLNADLENALEEGGPRNGVRTAVEDFLKEEPDRWHWQALQGLHGLGILIPRSRLVRQPGLNALLNDMHASPCLRAHIDMLESDRLRELANNATIIHRIRQRDEQMRMQQERWREATEKADRLRTLESERSVLQTENVRLNAIIDALEGKHAHIMREIANAQATSMRMQAALDHIHTTRTFRWTAWIRRCAGLLRR